MEELLEKITDPIIRDYMRESMMCYMAGAYRASIVLSFISIFDDVLAKLGELGRVNKKAKKICDEAIKKRDDQEVFETFLIDQMKAHSLLPKLDSAFLETLRNHRNKAAHPSGHHSSPEEARYVFFEAVSRFLSKPILSTTQLVDEILTKMSDEYFFPATDIKITSKVVAREIQTLHSEVYPYLISKLIDKLATTGVVEKNSRFFLNGLANNGGDEIVNSLKKYVVDKYCANDSYRRVIISTLCANGNIYKDLEDIVYQRLAVMISAQIKEVELSISHNKFSHPVMLFVSLVKTNGEMLIKEKLGIQYNELIDRFPYSEYLMKEIVKHDALRKVLIDIFFQNAGSMSFRIANKFADHASDIDKIMGNFFLGKQAIQLLANVVKAANNNALDSIALQDADFKNMPNIKNKTKIYIKANLADSENIVSEIFGGENKKAKEFLKRFI